MGNHRADRRGPGRRPSDLPTPVASATSAGKRRADKPTKADRAVTATIVERTAEVPVPSTSEKNPRPTEKRSTAKRSAGRRAASRGPLFRVLPSPPILLGVAALAISAGGAVTAAGGGLGDDDAKFNAASALSGASDVSRVSLLDRDTVSRDSRRDALEDSVDAELVAEAEDQAQQRDAALKKFAALAESQADKLALNQWVLPIEAGVYHLTAEFGDYGLWSHYHTGLDFAAPTGTPLHAIANGVVTSVGYDGAYGNKTVITLDDGTELWFCHQTSFLVNEGDTVSAGDVIGTVGSTGNVTGPHLHLEVRPGAGDPVDPYEAMVVNGITP
jgi:murein DD-endopeptidase MepM/ murein hydrolase activator NlpD